MRHTVASRSNSMMTRSLRVTSIQHKTERNSSKPRCYQRERDTTCSDTSLTIPCIIRQHIGEGTIHKLHHFTPSHAPNVFLPPRYSTIIIEKRKVRFYCQYSRNSTKMPNMQINIHPSQGINNFIPYKFTVLSDPDPNNNIKPISNI